MSSMSSHQTCKRCLYTSDHPLGLTIDEEGICSGCRVHEEKDQLDWDERWHALEQLVTPYKSKDTRHYDCIIPVSGAQDSYYIVHTVKERLGLNPLLVTYNKYWNTPLGIRNLANLRIRFNCDIITQNVNPLSVKKITKTTLRMLGSIYWHCIAGQTVFPVQTAVRFKIPLIIWGAHQGMEQVGMFSHTHEVEMTRRYRKDHDLMGYEADDLLSNFDTLTEADIWQYRYPDDTDLNAVGVRGIYLNNYVRWDPKAQHEFMIEKHLYETAAFSRTFDTYDFVDCYNYMNIHDLLKTYKHGYGKVTDHACREIRHRRISREQASQLVSYYQNRPVSFTNMFCDWLGVIPESLYSVMNQFRNTAHWQRDENWQWQEKIKPPPPDNMEDMIHFELNSSQDRNKPTGYITIGKGFP